LDRGECWWSTERSGWFGHQSRFVLGRVALGVGEGIAGFSLSLTLSVASFLSDTSVVLLSGCFLLMALRS
jgi:kynureninase